MPHITMSVVVPSYRRASDLTRCLGAVARQCRLPDEVLVIARDGDMKTAAVVSEFRQHLRAVRVAHVSDPGLLAALNKGLDAAAGEIIVFTDDDAEAAPDWLALIETAFQDDAVGAVGGRDWLQLPKEPKLYQPSQATRVGFLSWYGKQFGNHHRPVREHRQKVMFLKGVNMAFRKQALRGNRIDTSLRGTGAQVGTEIDLCMKVRQAGYQVLFDDRILVKHYVGERPADDNRTEVGGTVWSDISFNYQYLVAKHFTLSRAIAYLFNGMLLGSLFAPGIAVAVLRSLKGDNSAWQRGMKIAQVRWAGFRAGRAAKALRRFAKR